MRRNLGVIAILLLFGLTACAEAPLPPPAPLAPNLARIYFYRLQEVNQTQSWTSVSLNADKIGDSAPGTYFYRDVTPGTYTVKLRSERNYDNQFQTVTATPGSTLFVKIYIPQELGMMGVGLYWDGSTATIPRLEQQNIFADQVVNPLFAEQEMAALRPSAG